MALIRCPECNREISDTALSCPNCGFNMEKRPKDDFIKVVKPLSKVSKSGRAKTVALVIGSILLIAVGIPLIAIGIGVVMIIIGIIGFFSAFSEYKKHQYGNCPYCNTELKVVVGNTSFKCPICNNVGVQTDTTLESMHPVDTEQAMKQ